MSVLVPIATFAVLLAAGLGPFAITIFLWRRRLANHVRQSPLTRNLLRPVGTSLREKLDREMSELYSWMMTFSMLPLIAFLTYAIRIAYVSREQAAIEIPFVVFITTLAIAFLACKAWKTLDKIRDVRLGLEGELAVGEELNQLMLHGCRVFHDIPFEYGNIDHVVVSKSGVYSVETKAVSKPKTGQDRAVIAVDHERNAVEFPHFTFYVPVAQLESQARWLTNMLTESTAIPVQVDSMLALPGWFIQKRIGRGKFYAFNPHKPVKLFVQNRQRFSQDEMQRIAHQLEQLCRHVQPSYR